MNPLQTIKLLNSKVIIEGRHQVAIATNWIIEFLSYNKSLQLLKYQVVIVVVTFSDCCQVVVDQFYITLTLILLESLIDSNDRYV